MFGKHEMFLHSFDIKDTLNGEFYVTVTAKTLELFCLTACLKKMTEMEMPNSWKNLHVLTERIYNNTRPPFLEWLKKKEGNSLFPLLECDDAHIYLIEERVSNGKIEAWLQKYFDIVFKNQLKVWSADEKSGPQKRTYFIFKEWFSVSYQSMIYDLENYRLKKIFPEQGKV